MKKNKRDHSDQSSLTLKNEIIGITFLFIAIFLLFCLVSFTPTDPSPYHSPAKNQKNITQNYGGNVGAYLSSHFFAFFGYASIILAVYLFFITVFFLYNKKINNIVTKSFGFLLLLISGSSFLANISPPSTKQGIQINSGGLTGRFINEFFVFEIGRFFSFLLFFLLVVISITLITKLSLKRVAAFSINLGGKVYRMVRKLTQEWLTRHRKQRRMKKIQQKYQEPEPEAASPIKKLTTKKTRNKKKIVRQPSKIPEERSLFEDLSSEFSSHKKYQPPPLSYLDAPSDRYAIDYKELESKKVDLLERLNEFKIGGDIQEYTPGPVITTYEFVPDSGIKVKNVTNLSEDLALVARAQYVRIERILGKKAIGIEVPNKKREVIHLKEVFESEQFRRASSPLTLGIGKTKSGEIFTTDLREMPHLIIAGATGSGKSVAIHSILLSLLYKSPPEMVKLVLIDPKRVELAIYNSIPHLLTPVVVNTKLAKNALDWAIWEMEQRYKKLALLQVRNIDQYNKKLELLQQSKDEILESLEDTDLIPYIVIVIDEFADLMIESAREIEDNIGRLAQKARATGIHLILATQRPSTDVITGTIKNNFPSRIAMAVPSKFDSRTVIDVGGAEKLLGEGDMLFLPPKTATLIRLHGAFVSEIEVLRIVKHLAKAQKPEFDTSVIKPRAEKAEITSGRGLDPKFFEAARTILATGQASASYLQRKMQVGYARAGRIMDQLEEKGVVSAPNSKNQRDILMSHEDLEALESQD